MYDEGIRAARRKARAKLHHWGVKAPEHIRIEAFAKKAGASIEEAPLDGAQSQLIRNGDAITILVAEHIKDPGARRFSIAHELGHLELKHPSCSPAELAAPRRRRPNSERSYETEANVFATETLMPEELVRSLCEVSPMNMDVVHKIAATYRVSRLASAIRCVELASERCAAVFCKDGAVKWMAGSRTFKHEIKRGARLDGHTVAYDFFKAGKLDERAQPVAADAWLDTEADVEIIEHSVASVDHGTTLTMLWIPEAASYDIDREA